MNWTITKRVPCTHGEIAHDVCAYLEGRNEILVQNVTKNRRVITINGCPAYEEDKRHGKQRFFRLVTEISLTQSRPLRANKLRVSAKRKAINAER